MRRGAPTPLAQLVLNQVQIMPMLMNSCFCELIIEVYPAIMIRVEKPDTATALWHSSSNLHGSPYSFVSEISCEPNDQYGSMNLKCDTDTVILGPV